MRYLIYWCILCNHNSWSQIALYINKELLFIYTLLIYLLIYRSYWVKSKVPVLLWTLYVTWTTFSPYNDYILLVCYPHRINCRFCTVQFIARIKTSKSTFQSRSKMKTSAWVWCEMQKHRQMHRCMMLIGFISRFLSSCDVVIRFTACTVRLVADWCQQRFAARIRMQNGERGAQQMTESGQV